MKAFLYSFLLGLVFLSILAGCESVQRKNPSFVGVRDGQFVRNDSVYRFIGTNFWYGAILGSEGQGGNRERLVAELDSLHGLGLDNLRILVGADGDKPKFSLVWPTLQTAPGVYNDTVLAGLDWLLKEMGERGMTAVLYLNNSWEWSGGYGQYLEWAGEGPCPDPTNDGYKTYVRHAGRFSTNEKAQQLFLNHVRAMVSRTNRYTGVPYTDDPTIMAWQVGNEPRHFLKDSVSKVGFAKWIAKTAALIKEIDKNHLVSVGSEGSVGCEGDIELYETIHQDSFIDYLTIHIWPMNWGWISRDAMRAAQSGPDSALMKVVFDRTLSYMNAHFAIAERLNKPIVLEEFGFARDGLSFDLSSSTSARDTYYKYIVERFLDKTANPHFVGINFWAWSGLAKPKNIRWKPFDDYCGDPAQEEQGLYSVFATDSSTISLLRKATKAMR